MFNDYKNFNNEIIKTAVSLELINTEAKNSPENLVKYGESMYRDQIKAVLKEICEKNYKIILVTGASSAGKTTSSKLIRLGLKRKGINSTVISIDDFFLDRDKTPKLADGSYDFENVTSVDINGYKEFIKKIIKTGKAKLPHFDFVLGKRTSYSEIEVKNDDILIIEGIHALNPLLQTGNDKKIYKVYVAVNTHYVIGNEIPITCKQLRLMRRLLRDYYTRGASVDSTIKQWKNVCRGEDEYIIPYKHTANAIINTAHIYEPLLYDKYLQPILKLATPTDAVKELLYGFSRTGVLSSDYVPDDSLLWEFIPENEKKKNK